jgi:hypothetical protein
MDRVTEIIGGAGLGPDFSMVKSEVLEWARARGTALHAAIHYFHKGTLDEATIHEEWLGLFHAYLRFLAESGHEPVHSEIEVEHPTWKYVGHPDRIGRIGGFPGLAIIDWKATSAFDPDYVRLQTAGYRLAWNAMHPEAQVHKCFGLHLRKDATYRFHDVTPDQATEQLFLAALLVYRERKRRKLL